MKVFIILLSVVLIFQSCSSSSSPVTGWDYNNPKNGGFQKVPYEEQETGPGLILITGGDLVIQLDQESEKKELTVKVPSFYLDETEVTNQSWLEYLYWIERTFGNDFPTVFYNALPDTSCWKEKVGDYQGYQMNYLRHPAYVNYPVVGVDWMQANNYCSWRTDRVNEFILIREGVLYHNPNQQNEPFTTEAYYSSQYESGINPTGQLPDLDPSKSGYNSTSGKVKHTDLATRHVRMEDGIMLPRYRLPTEAEWEYAAVAGTDKETKRSKEVRKGWKKSDMALMYDKNWNAGSSIFQNESNLTSPVNSYLPNDYGIYNMHSNASEWVADVYKSRTEDNIQLFAPLVSDDQIKTKVHSAGGYKLQKYDEVIYNVEELGRYLNQFEWEVSKRANLDSIQMDFFSQVRSYMDEVNRFYNEGNIIEASSYVRIILDEILEMYEAENINYHFGGNFTNQEIYFEMRVGIAQFVLFHPGQIPTKDQTPEESIRRRNVNNRLDWESDYDEKLDSMSIVNEDRVIKGKSFIDKSTNEDAHFRTSLNKYESACYVGFRCAMQRVGSPGGLGKK